MIKEGQKIQRRDKKQTLKKYSSQENKAKEKEKKTRSKHRKLHRLHLNREWTQVLMKGKQFPLDVLYMLCY